MEYATLSATGSTVSRCWLGTVALGGWGDTDLAESADVIRAALDAGITAIDTADSYGEGAAEEIVGQAVRRRRDSVVISTKFGFEPRTSAAVRSEGDQIRQQLEGSLRRLDTDYVDLYFLHRLTPSTDLEATLVALDELVQAGKVRAIGTSMATAAALGALDECARQREVVSVAVEQPPLSIFVRQIEQDILPACRRLGVDVVGYAPLNGGWLTGKYRRAAPAPEGSRAATWPIRRERYDFDRSEIVRKLHLVERLGAIADDCGRTLSQLAIGFALSNPDVVATIIGPRTRAQLDALIDPFPGPLELDVLEQIDRLVEPGTTIDPHDLHGYAVT